MPEIRFHDCASAIIMKSCSGNAWWYSLPKTGPRAAAAASASPSAICLAGKRRPLEPGRADQEHQHQQQVGGGLGPLAREKTTDERLDHTEQDAAVERAD